MIFLPMLVHGSWDVALISGQIGPDPATSPLAAVPLALQIILIVALISARHRIEPYRATPTTP